MLYMRQTVDSIEEELLSVQKSNAEGRCAAQIYVEHRMFMYFEHIRQVTIATVKLEAGTN